MALDRGNKLRGRAAAADSRPLQQSRAGTEAEVERAARRSALGLPFKGEGLPPRAESPQPAEGTAARDRRGHASPVEAAEGEAKLARAADDGRRVRDKRVPSSDEAVGSSAAALAVAGAAAKAPLAAAISPRARLSAGGAEEAPIQEKKVERSASEPRLSVLDLRRSVESRRDAAAKAEAKTEEPLREALRETKAPGSESGREIYRELSLDTKGTGDSGGLPSAPKTEAGRAQDFQSMMAERMREAWNGEIVRSAHIVLRDGDAGVIRLRLRPESLGNVKIELNLSENNIRGKIVVESDEAKTAFEKNMNQLADAFKQGGFDSASLEVSVGGGSGGKASGDGARAGLPSGESGGPFFSERLRSPSSLDSAPAALSRRGSAVDLLV